MSMIVKVLPVGMLQTNCYILIDEATNEAVIVDPGDEGERIINMISDYGWKVDRILITHGHYDHIMDTVKVRDALGAKIIIHADEEEYLYNPDLSLMSVLMKDSESFTADQVVREGDEIQVGESTVKVIKVPGHTRASICYYNEKDKLLIAGDTLFRDSIGRTDLYDGSPGDLANNIKEKLLILPDEVIVYAGHGPSTSIGYEKTNNPFLR
ncbi:MBL fold metallo-hydrolase [Vallitalea okinawensis]|uniref:MBL fold metallo-hydrolase n=1 Tax=Vallitalea okinawensis TaxID=2078660 RepID=UPI000CFAAA24|nr:MBL fold metallo-hydrolase [Vallitalea okinawensis]